MVLIKRTTLDRKQTAITRKTQIRELLQRYEEVEIPALAEQFGVSEMTIRRDLDELERDGLARRTHGGAIYSERMSFEFDFHQRRIAMHAEKQAIARQAALLVQPGHRVILDTGTTALELALRLRDMRDLTVITPSLAVASALQFAEGVQVILLGGILRRGRPDLTGGLTEHTMELFSADLLFQGADGIDREGWIYNEDIQLARVDQRMRERAAATYILADSSKIGQTSLIRCGRLGEVRALITDVGIAQDDLRVFREAGYVVELVEPED